MAFNQNTSMKLIELRRRVEGILKVTRSKIATMPIKDIQQLVQTLQIHQVELEMQNEELRQTQLALRVSLDRYVALYDGAPIGYLTLDHEGAILEANLPACTLLGMNRIDVLAQPVIRFVTAKDQAAVLHHVRELVSTGTRQTFEVDLARRDNVQVSVRVESVAIHDHLEQQPHVLIALMDITDRSRMETTLRQYQQGLVRQQRLEERERLSHDLHDGILQSLFAIGLSLEAIKMKPSKVSDETSVTLGRGVDELNSVMLAMRKFILELGPEHRQEAVLSTIELSDSLHVMGETLAQLHGRQIRVSVAHAIASGLSHVQRLEILKLAKEAISNSFRHAEAPLVSVSLNSIKGNIRLTVQDNGKGFHLKEKKGQGHGLINMAARAKELGGKLSVRSLPGKGTSVIFDLPQKTTANTAPSKETPVIAASSGL
jgi:PAS domain S-box-containing protein